MMRRASLQLVSVPTELSWQARPRLIPLGWHSGAVQILR